MVEPIRRARPRALVAFIALHMALTVVVNLVLFAGEWFRPLALATGGLITGTLIVNAALVVVVVRWVVTRWGRLRPYDVGLIGGNIVPGVAAGFGLWALAQAVHLAAGALANGAVLLHPAWAQPAVPIGMLAAQIFGNALFEEIAYRGFLFPQLYLAFERLAAWRWGRFFAALFVSQGVFALSHIANRVYLGLSTADIALDLLMLVGWGTLYTLIYMRTDNLFLAVTVHALGNAPTTLFATVSVLDGAAASFLYYGIVVLVLFVAPLWLALRRPPAVRAEPAEATEPAAD
jgi:membrane protease YdiL (CAAX protease family)